MNPLTIINVAANVAVAGSVFLLSMRVFGRPDHPIHARPVFLFARKFVSSVVICGSVMNVITLSTPSWTEVLLNVGFSLSYIWSICYDDRIASAKHPASTTTLPKRNSSGRVGGSRKAKQDSASSSKRRLRAAS